MITTRKLSIALCATLLLAPLGLLTAQTHGDTGGFYLGASYGVALPAERDISDHSKTSTFAIQSDFGFFGGQIEVGYAISGFRPGISVGYHRASIPSIRFKKLVGASEEDLKTVNDRINEADIDGSVSSLELAASVYYDIDTGTPITPYIGIGGGISNVSVKLTVPDLPPISVVVGDALWAVAFKGAAGIGYAVTEQMTCFLGYRLTGTFEGEFSKDKTILLTALIHNVEAGLRFRF